MLGKKISTYGSAAERIANQSAWPARAMDTAKFRYYFTLDGATTPDQIVVTARFRFTREDGLETSLTAR